MHLARGAPLLVARLLASSRPLAAADSPDIALGAGCREEWTKRLGRPNPYTSPDGARTYRASFRRAGGP